MSDYAETTAARPRRSVALYAWIIVPPLLLVGLLVVTFLRGGRDTRVGDKGVKHGKAEENVLANVRKALAEQADLAACRNAVGQLNLHLQKTKHPEPLPAARLNKLKADFALSDGDVTELNSPTFTPLDAFHLEECFLLRDAAKSLELNAPGGRKGKPVKAEPLDRARLAFEWVCRQVRLTPPSALDARPAPPAFVLRRGSGTAAERAVVFAALLEQFGLQDGGGLQGCLLFSGRGKKPTDLWACGVVPAAEPETMYLFDPRIGLALPGPGGQGVATLKQARDDPAVLGQLKIEELSYDVNAERAKAAEAVVCVPLTALAPRMRLLQDVLLREASWADAEGNVYALPSAVRVKLAEEEPGALAAVSAASGKPARYWAEGAALLRSFVPEAEGGSDVPQPFALRQLRGFVEPDGTAAVLVPRRWVAFQEMVPWEDFPDPRRFPYDAGPGQSLRNIFAGPFVRWLEEPGSPRDLILRGQMARATAELVREQEQWQQSRSRGLDQATIRKGYPAWPEAIRRGADLWLDMANEAFAADGVAKLADRQAMTPRVAAVFKWKGGEPMDVLFGGAIADGAAAQRTYQLGLCKHEQAVRLLARAELAGRAGVRGDDDDRKAREAWDQAEYWWRQYLDNYPKRPGAWEARRRLAEAYQGQGEAANAAKVLAEAPAAEGELERFLQRWLAAKAK